MSSVKKSTVKKFLCPKNIKFIPRNLKNCQINQYPFLKKGNTVDMELYSLNFSCLITGTGKNPREM